MGLSWLQYNVLYYLIQYGLFLAIYVFLVVFIPYDLMGWIAETLLFLKKDEKHEKSTHISANSDNHKNTYTRKNESSCCCTWKPCNELDTNERKNWCSCCCLWMPLEDKDVNERKYDFSWRWFCMSSNDEDSEIPTNYRSWCCIRWLFKDRKTKKDTNKNMNMHPIIPPWCTCQYIWEFFAKVFRCECKCWKCCKCCEYRTCCANPNDCENCLINLSHCCCECACGEDDLKNKLLPHHYHLNLERTTKSRYCGFFYMNLNRMGLYLLLCAALWSAAVVLFEGIILAYTTANNGDSCPTPKKGTPATIVDCFIFQSPFDVTPINTTFATQCNSSTTLSFVGSSAACFAWIYADVDVVDVIEELGICTGVAALFGTLVAIMSYLCRRHRWRFIFDLIAIFAAAGIPILVYKKGDIPFLTYILLASLIITVIITEYLLNYVPLLTGLCFANRIFRCIQYRAEPSKSRVKRDIDPVMTTRRSYNNYSPDDRSLDRLSRVDRPVNYW